MTSFSGADHSHNLIPRSKSFANNVIHRLKRRVSFAGGNSKGALTRPSFHMRSQANLSIYRVSEASNESPEKQSAGGNRSSIAQKKSNSKEKKDGLGSRGRVSASFYFHANKLSVWQSNVSDNNREDAESYMDQEESKVGLTLKVPKLGELSKSHRSLSK